MCNSAHYVDKNHDGIVIQMYTSGGQIGRPPIETNVGPEIVLRGYAAAAMRLLIDANWGHVHVSEMRPDAPARLHQAGVKIRADVRPQFGEGNRQCWLTLDGVRARIVRELSVEVVS